MSAQTPPKCYFSSPSAATSNHIGSQTFLLHILSCDWVLITLTCRSHTSHFSSTRIGSENSEGARGKERKCNFLNITRAFSSRMHCGNERWKQHVSLFRAMGLRGTFCCYHLTQTSGIFLSMERNVPRNNRHHKTCTQCGCIVYSFSHIPTEEGFRAVEKGIWIQLKFERNSI